MYDEKCLLRIGSNIKLLRSVRQLNQHQLAERLGISQTHLSNIEHNNVLVSLKLLVRSANVLGCSLEALLDKAAASSGLERIVQMEVKRQKTKAKVSVKAGAVLMLRGRSSIRLRKCGCC